MGFVKLVNDLTSKTTDSMTSNKENKREMMKPTKLANGPPSATWKIQKYVQNCLILLVKGYCGSILLILVLCGFVEVQHSGKFNIAILWTF